MTPSERDELLRLLDQPLTLPVVDYVDSLLAQARAEAFEEAAKVCERRVVSSDVPLQQHNERAMSAAECAATIRARKDAI